MTPETQDQTVVEIAWVWFGSFLACGRQTVMTWIRAAGLSGRFQSYSITVAVTGREAGSITDRLLTEVVAPLATGAERITLTIG